MTFISYSQNFEDVLLNRVFKYKNNGFYIDIGALHPSFDSVTKAFYDRGWSGINVEPIKDYFNLFLQERQRDINLNIAISNVEGNLDFFEVVGQPGNSTLNKSIAYEIAKEKGLEVSQHNIPVKTLEQICQEYVNQKIDFLKIDVEGLEEQVILGGNWETFRPTVLVIETTLPNTNIRCENQISIFLQDKGYQHVFFDGINDYYIAQESSELVKHFLFPVNILDFYVDYRLVEKQREINYLNSIIKSKHEPLTTYQLDNKQSEKLNLAKPTIVIDAVFFQLYNTGIARVWRSLLEQWANTEFANHILVLDRANTAPKIPGIRYRTIHRYDYNNTEADKQILQQICEEEQAELFISSYYTTPIETPSVFMAYDMIPEVIGRNLNQPMWREKHHAIQHASAYISISQNTAKDLSKFFSDIPLESIKVAHCGVDPLFSPASQNEINAFKYKYGINKPYFILGGLGGYKNAILFFQAFNQLVNKQGFDIVATGAGSKLTPEWREYTAGCTFHSLELTDEELRLAYAGAVALVYPSKYEGFGMPIIEAMACGCPVITCPNSSITEVGGEAAIYVNDDDVIALADALCEVEKPSIRNTLINAGLAQAQKFSWSKMAEIVSTALMDATLLSLNLREINYIIFPDWTQPEEEVGFELQQVIQALATHPQNAQITLLIYTGNIAREDAEMFLSSVAMNLLMEDLDISDTINISFVDNLEDKQWVLLLSLKTAGITLEYEDRKISSQIALEKIPFYAINNLNENLSHLSDRINNIQSKIFNLIDYKIKDITIKIPQAHALPIYQDKFRLYDKFIGILAKYLPNQEDLIIDIGANVGDTTALIIQYCENPIFSIEADEDFFNIMQLNLADYTQRVTCINSFVSENENSYKNVELIKQNGTARAVVKTDKLTKSNSLKYILNSLKAKKCILLKTDTDGFDFEILLSSLNIIQENSPIIYWENEIASLKDLEIAQNLLKNLADINYTKYIVLDNFGNPLTYDGSAQFVEHINEYLLNNIYSKNRTLYYTDIAAFPDKYSHLISSIASEYNDFIKSTNLYP
jgi:FkbM family methyltransferase